MLKFIIPGLLLTAVAAYGGEALIVETDTGISVEYSGTPAAKDAEPGRTTASSETNAPPVPANPGQVARARFIAAQLQQLNREASDAAKLTGNESDEELAAKSSLAAEKRGAADKYADEYRKLAGTAPAAPSEATAPEVAAVTDNTQSALTKQRNDRAERMRQTKALRGGSGSASAQQ